LLYSFSDRVIAPVLIPGNYPHKVEGYWSWVLDPPANVLSGQVTFQYDPSLIGILPQYSGFIGDFSDDPSTAIPIGSTDTSPLDVSDLPGPRAGMNWSLTVGPDTVTLTFDDSSNPVAIDNRTGSVNFFVLSIVTFQPVSGWVPDTSGPGQFLELGGQTYSICSSATLGQYYCGDTAASSYGNNGFLAVIVPESSTLAMLAIGLLVLALLKRSRPTLLAGW
jgi:hypothetical protein